MGDAHLPSEPSRTGARDALVDARRRTAAVARPGERGPAGGGAGMLALQRRAGNAAVNALLSARSRDPEPAASEAIDAGLRELRGDDPQIDAVERGLVAAKNAGVPVDLEGPKPPPSALEVRTTGFGPESVPQKKAAPPQKAVPKKSALGKAAGARGAASAKGRHAATSRAPEGAGAGPGGGMALGDGGAPGPLGAGPLPADQLLQPPTPPPGVRPEQDPAFTAVTTGVRAVGAAKQAHPPATAKAAEAQGAAEPPGNDREAQAKAAKADTMDAQQPGEFDKKAFIAAVKTAIEAKSPRTLKEADNYKESGQAGEVKGEVKGLVTEGKEGQAKDIETATEAPPDESKAVPKQVAPMHPEPPGAVPKVAAEGAVPKPAPAEQVNLEAGKQQANQELAAADVTEQQLQQSGEPDFQQAVAGKKAAAEHADTAPGQFRKHEQQVIEQQRAEAAGETQAGLVGMHSTKATALAGLVGDKATTKSKDEARRAEVTAKVQGIFASTEADVKKILDEIDPKVESAFEKGEAGARAQFEDYVDAKMTAYKKDRYGGWLGGLRWAKDKLLGMPSKVDEFYKAGRELYLKRMDLVISQVADIVGHDLTAAKKRIAAGRAEIASYVRSLPKELQKVGSEASKEIGARFSQLESDVQAKQETVVDTLATKYVDARKGLDERIEALQAENRGLVDKVVGAIKAVVNTIRELAAMLRNVLARAAGVVGQIIKNPSGFLDNLIAGIKGGILRFKDNFVEHLRKGLLSWLFGALASGGVELPETFDVKGVIKLLASIFGLTWRTVRTRIVRQVGERAMGAIESGVSLFQKLAAQGVGGLWELLLEKLGDVKEMILEQVKDFVLTKIITAGITWLISLLNPAAAFIKACKLIYDVVMFFVHNASRIARFVTTVLDSVADVVRGNVGGVMAKIEDVLGQMVPIIIGFLASLVGLGGIGQKVRKIVTTLRKPFTRAVDAVVKTGLKLAGPLIRGLKGIGSRVKAKVAAGKAYVKGKVEAGKQWAKRKVYGGDDSPEGKRTRLTRGLSAGVAALDRYRGRRVAEALIRPVLAGVRMRFGMAALEPVRRGDRWAVRGVVNPEDTKETEAGAVDELSEVLKAKRAALTTPEAIQQFDFMRGRTKDMARFETAILNKEGGGSRARPPRSLDDLLAADFAKRTAAATPPSEELVAAIDEVLREILAVEARATGLPSKRTHAWSAWTAGSRHSRVRERPLRRRSPAQRPPPRGGSSSTPRESEELTARSNSPGYPVTSWKWRCRSRVGERSPTWTSSPTAGGLGRTRRTTSSSASGPTAGPTT